MKRKLRINKAMLMRIIKILKWGKLVAKLTAIGTTVSGAITAFSGSATSGIALSAAGATTYAATKGLPTADYEKTKHIPPGRVDRTANYLRAMEIAKPNLKGKKRGGIKVPDDKPDDKLMRKLLQGGLPISQQTPARLAGMPITLLARKK